MSFFREAGWFYCRFLLILSPPSDVCCHCPGSLLPPYCLYSCNRWLTVLLVLSPFNLLHTLTAEWASNIGLIHVIPIYPPTYTSNLREPFISFPSLWGDRSIVWPLSGPLSLCLHSHYIGLFELLRQPCSHSLLYLFKCCLQYLNVFPPHFVTELTLQNHPYSAVLTQTSLPLEGSSDHSCFHSPF